MKHLRFAKNLKIISFLNINRSARIITIIISISILLLILFGTINPNFLHFNNFLNMGHQMAVTAVIAFAMTAVILAKGIDLSVGSTLAVSGVVGGLAIQNGFSAILVILIILLVGTLVGSLNGFLITKIGISPFIATLGTMALGSGAALSLSNASSIMINDPMVTWLGSAFIGPVPVSIIFTIFLFALWWALLNRTILGRFIYAVGGNYEASKASAIRVKWIQFFTYVSTGISAAIASILLIGRVQSAQPLGGFGLEFEVITGVIIGGTLLMGGVGGVLGTLFGVILVTIIRTGLSFFGAPQEVIYVVTGAMVLFSVILYSPNTISSLKKLRFRSNKQNLFKSELVENRHNRKVLSLSKIQKKYSGSIALNDVSFQISSSEVVALVGENGAGKSTIVKILSGNIFPSSGDILINDKKLVFENTNSSREAGIGVVHQHYSLVPELTITENLFLGRELKVKGTPILLRNKMKKITKNLLKDFDIQLDPDTKVNTLTVGQRQLIEVIKAILGNPWLIIMDEPTSSLSESESERLYDLINQLKERNVAVLYISHKMDEIYKLCQRAVILRDGNLVSDVQLEGTSEDKIVNMMVGRNIDNVFPYTKSEIGEVAIKVNNISDGWLLKNCSFEVKKGEVVVLAGLMGSGRTEVLKTIFGLNKAVTGEVFINGEKVDRRSPKRLKDRMHIAYVPEDRHSAGIIPTLTVRENLSLVSIQRNNNMGIIDLKEEKKIVTETIQRMNVRPPDPYKLIANLSGGNQQKIVLGKWLLMNPKILLLDDPTRGVDVGAKAEIHELIANLKKQGVAILMVSSELTEALHVADRIVVMSEGRSVKELMHGATEEEVMHYALGMHEKTKEVVQV